MVIHVGMLRAASSQLHVARVILNDGNRFQILMKGRGGQPQWQNEPERISSSNPSPPIDGTSTSKAQTKSGPRLF